MSKQFDKLEEIFELPDLDEVKGVTVTSDEVHAALEQAEEIEKEFEKIDHFDQHDEEMDELAELAKQAHKDLQELGMNVEVKHAGEIFSSSSQMLKIAVDAKNLKVEKKLKLLKLQLDKMRIDRMGSSESSNTVDGTAVALDRNEILKHLRQMNGGDK
jgi:phage I-like protein